MPVRLLESGSRKTRFVGGTVTSVGLHTALILGALYATAHAHPAVPDRPTSIRTIYFPPRPVTAPLSREKAPATLPVGRTLQFVRVPTIDVKTPTIDVTMDASTPMDFARTGISLGQADAADVSGPGSTTAAFRADQVERQVAVVPGSAPPEYPEMLRRAGVEGTVVATFIVGGDGRAEVDSIRFLRSDNRQFEDAVRAALRRMRFVPAEVGGRKVRQLVQMPFVFTLAR
ncbi:MAG: TonB family protein [Gemmatimonadaceae bacterium]